MIAFNPENNSWCSFPLSVLFMDKTQQQQQQKNPKNHRDLNQCKNTQVVFGGFRWDKKKESVDICRW